MKYVDGFVLPVPKKKLKAYFAMAKKAAKIWARLSSAGRPSSAEVRGSSFSAYQPST